MLNSHEQNRNRTLIEQLEHWSIISPDKIALSDKHQKLTFLQLSERVRGIAEAIESLKIRYNHSGHIAVIVDRDVESACLALACLVFGIPFAPIDIEWPRDRFAFALEQLGNPNFVIAPSSRSSFVGDLVSKAVKVEHPNSGNWFPQGQSSETESPEIVQKSDSGGLIIFTSGTTGVPKGVVFDGEAMTARFSVRSDRRIGRSEPLLPDSAVSSLCYPFHFIAGLFLLLDVAEGTSVYIFSVDEMAIEAFLPLVQQMRINKLSIPPSLVILMASNTNEANFKKLTEVRQLLWAGDSVSYETIQGLKRYLEPDVEIRNGFGATEAVSWMNHSLKLSDAPKGGTIPIGRLQDDAPFRLEPVGDMPDRFIVWSPGPMASGYLNNQELTNQRFVFDEKGKRWWISGDIVRVDDEGYIFHDSRIDDLVKIRGKLVSPSEAKRALLAIDGIDDAMVLAEQGESDKYLVAHIQISPRSSITALAIRRQLSKVLPSYLVPQHFMKHVSLPKNSRGKPDLVALTKIPFVPLVDRKLRTPVTFTEYAVARVAKKVIQNQSLSIEDDLWDYGLDSLAALQMESLLSSDFPQVSLDLIAQKKTIEKISRAIDETAERDNAPQVVFNEGSSTGVVHAFPGLGNVATHYALLANSLGSCPRFVVHKYQSGIISRQNTSFENQAEAISLEILQSSGDSRIRLVGYSAGGMLAYRIAQLLMESGRDVDLAILDTSIRLLTKKTYGRNTGAGLVGRTSFLATKLTSTYKMFVEGMVRQGLRRGLKVAFVERPLKSLIKLRIVRAILWRMEKPLSWILPSSIMVLITDLMVSQSRLEYRAKPMNSSSSNQLRAVYFHVSENKDHLYWRDIVPEVQLELVGGNHHTMLAHPHVSDLSKNLDAFWLSTKSAQSPIN